MIFNAYADGKEQVLGIQLVSCGHIFAKPGREINRPHGRDDWMLFYVAKENETFYFENAVIATPGSFVLFAPGEKQHHIHNGNKTAEFYYIHFRCKALPMQATLKTSQVYYLPFKRQLCDIFEELIEEMLNKKPFYEELCIYKLLHLLTLFERDTVNINNPSKATFDRIARAVQHMNRYYNSNFTLTDYADMCNMSKYHFSRVFKEVTGRTPLEYRNDIRLEHAAELLREEQLSVEEVSTALGFSSASYFSFAFKKKFGSSPKNHQQRN